MFQLDMIIHLRSTLESKGSQIKQTGWDTYFICRSLQKTSRFQNSITDRLITKANEKLKTQKVPKTKD